MALTECSRPVSNLTSSQLARKRDNDGNAERAIRQRTKDRIAELETKVEDLTRRDQVLEQELKIPRESRNKLPYVHEIQ